MRILFYLSFFLFLVSIRIYATPSSEILQKMQALKITGSVLYIAAHPDDENTRLLTYLSKDMKIRAGYLSLTRGDGGQNLIGKEQGEKLGLIRTNELMEARKIDGAVQFFTRAYDFGYSKTPDETFRFWNKDSILSDVVYIIRKFRPDIIICRFPTTGEGGHGHHTASALLALEAFRIAGDPTKFPEQVADLGTWSPKKILWNTFNFGGTNTTSEDQIKIDVGGYNPLLGKSYGEIAAESRSSHKSQGFGSAKNRGEQIEYFKLLEGDTSRSLFGNVDVTWKRFKGTDNIVKLIDDCIDKFQPSFPERSVKMITAAKAALEQWEPNDPTSDLYKEVKLKEFDDLILHCAGFWSEATIPVPYVVPGETHQFQIQFLVRNKSNVKVKRIVYENSDSSLNLSLDFNKMYSFKRKEKIHEEKTYSNPYWLNNERSEGRFDHQQASVVKPINNPPFWVFLFIEVEGEPMRIVMPVVYKSTDPVKGEIYRKIEVVPPVTVNLDRKTYMFPDKSPKEIRFTVKAFADSVKGIAEVTLPPGWGLVKGNEGSLAFDLKKKGEEKKFTVRITPSNVASEGYLSVSVNSGGKVYAQSLERVDYDHIPYQFMLSPSRSKIVSSDIKFEKAVIGFIPGAGDDVADCLSQLGYKVVTLQDLSLSTLDLSIYKAIITGVRAYNTNEDLQQYYPALMNYVQQGGNLIVQYNTNNRIGPVIARISPYDLNISRNRVTDEDSPVKIASPDHLAVLQPNKITSEDFKDWVQERGIYFATELSPQYKNILTMNDPGEKDLDGSLVIAKYGKGNFVYTGLAFFRQLPAGVPGAYRLMANLIQLKAD